MKDEKQVQNETTETKEVKEVKTTNGLDVTQVMSNLDFTPEEDSEQTTEEQSDFVPIPDLFLECKTSVKNGKTFKDYILHGKLRSVPVKIYFRPGKNSSGFTDVNSYSLLDIVFNGASTSLFAVRVITRVNALTQRRTRRMEYVAYSKDESTGMEYYAPLVLDTISDKAMLDQLLTSSALKYDLELPL